MGGCSSLEALLLHRELQQNLSAVRHLVGQCSAVVESLPMFWNLRSRLQAVRVTMPECPLVVD